MDVKICKAHNKDGSLCQRAVKEGWNVCHYHGAKGGRPIVNGTRSKQIAALPNVDALLQSYLQDPALLDLSQDVAWLRMIRDNLKQHLDMSEKLSEEDRKAILEITDATSRVIERKSRVDNAHALTIAHVQLIKAELVRFVLSLPEQYRDNAETMLRNTLMLKPDESDLSQ